MFRFRPIRDQPFYGFDRDTKDVSFVDGFDAVNSTFPIVNIEVTGNVEDEYAVG